MNTKYKFIHFEETTESINGRTVWNCVNNKSGNVLSKIFYYAAWKEYCFTQYEQNVIFNDGCLLDTIDFIRQLNKLAKKKAGM